MFLIVVEGFFIDMFPLNYANDTMLRAIRLSHSLTLISMLFPLLVCDFLTILRAWEGLVWSSFGPNSFEEVNFAQLAKHQSTYQIFF